MEELLAELGLDGIVDVHVHPLPMLSEEELLREVRLARVRKAVLLALDVDPGQAHLAQELLLGQHGKRVDVHVHYTIEA